MMRKPWAALALLLLLLTACSAAPAQPETPSSGPASLVEPHAAAPDCPRDARPLTQQELQEMDGLFTLGSPYARALTSVYFRPDDVDLYSMFRGGDAPEQPLTQQEKEALRLLTDPDWVDNLPAHRIFRADMDAALEQCFGITLEETRQVGLDQLTYLPVTDTWYSFDSGMTYSGCTFDGGFALSDGRVQVYYYEELYNKYYVVTLWTTDGSWRIQSHAADGALPREPEPPVLPSDAVVLTEDQLSWWQQCFTADTWYTRALTSYYQDAHWADLSRLLRRQDPGEDTPLTQQELTALSQKQEGYYLRMTGYRHPRSRVQAGLARCFGLALEDMAQVGLDQLIYLDGTDAWYSFAPEGELAVPDISSGCTLPDGSVCLYYFNASARSWAVVTLRQESGSWHILSHLLCE